MEVTCELFGPLKSAVGRKTVKRTIEAGTTVRECLEGLVNEHPPLEDGLFEDDDLQESLTVTVNEVHLQHAGGPDRKLEEGDVIRVSPPFVGG